MESVTRLGMTLSEPTAQQREQLNITGGVLVGFGARYANGCTSGHSITGIANFNVPSIVATLCFFAGGLAVTWGLKILF